MQWIKDNCEVEQAQANKYMRLAYEWESLQKSSPTINLGIDAVLKQLASDRRKEKQQDFPADTPDFPPGNAASGTMRLKSISTPASNHTVASYMLPSYWPDHLANCC